MGKRGPPPKGRGRRRYKRKLRKYRAKCKKESRKRSRQTRPKRRKQRDDPPADPPADSPQEGDFAQPPRPGADADFAQPPRPGADLPARPALNRADTVMAEMIDRTDSTLEISLPTAMNATHAHASGRDRNFSDADANEMNV